MSGCATTAGMPGVCGRRSAQSGASPAGEVCQSPSVVARLLEGLRQAFDKRRGLRVGCEALVGTAAGVEHRRVPASAELAPDRREALIGVLAREVHGDLARPCQARLLAGRDELVSRQVEGSAGRSWNGVHGDRSGRDLAGSGRAELVEDVGGEVGVGRPAASARRRRRRGSGRPRAPAGRSVTREAISSSASSVGTGMSVCAACLRSTARRVAMSGGSISATSPDSKRARRRAVRRSRSRGTRSLVSTTWAPDSWSVLKVWKNSSSVCALPSGTGRRR